jgi:molybdopterin-guanine dinucleotide biosynthesis protein
MPNVTELYCVPVLGFVAASGTGKTTLLIRLIPVLRERGLRCAVIKHSHHDVAIDRPGKDSHRLAWLQTAGGITDRAGNDENCHGLTGR